MMPVKDSNQRRTTNHQEKRGKDKLTGPKSHAANSRLPARAPRGLNGQSDREADQWPNGPRPSYASAEDTL
ncbi:hypothetical protein JCM15831A_06300 [Asaia astilbis]